MASLQIEQYPAPLSLHRTPNLLEVSHASANSAAIGGVFNLIHTGAGGPVEGQQLVFDVNGERFTFTIASDPDGTGNQLPVWQNIDQFRSDVTAILATHARLTVYFNLIVEGTADIVVLCQSNQAPHPVITLVRNDFTGIQFTQSSYHLKPEAIGLSVLCRLSTDNNTGVPGFRDVVDLVAAFDVGQRARFDVNAIASPSIVLPPTLHLRPALGYAPAAGAAFAFADVPVSATTMFSSVVPTDVWVAPIQGDPPVIHRLTFVGTVHSLHGAEGALGSTPPFNTASNLVALLRDDTTSAAKRLFFCLADQPAWLYTYARTALVGVQAHIDYTLEDGTTGTSTLGQQHDLVANQVAAWPCGPRCLGISQFAQHAGKCVVLYTFSLRQNTKVLASTTIRVDNRPQPWALSLLFSNGVGGMETLSMQGKTTTSYSVTRELVAQPTSGAAHLQVGELASVNAAGRRTLTLSTGWQTPAEIAYYRQLLMGDVWLCDLAAQRFIRCVVDTEGVEVATDDEDLQAFSIEVIVATDEAANNLLRST